MRSRKCKTWLVISASQDEVERLTSSGPRRDFQELKNATEGTYVLRDGSKSGRTLRDRLLGAHVRQAWQAAGRVRSGDNVFADGEHTGFPLAIFLRLRRRRPARFVMLAHWITPRWKLLALRIASIVGAKATIVVHSVVQQSAASSAVGHRWKVVLMPYQVDTDFWTPRKCGSSDKRRFTVVAVGSENRDYDTLVRAAPQIDGDVVIAAGSHWARSIAGSGEPLPTNVTYLDETLGFEQLRELYRSASVVVVPLHDVDNQSGVTAILEGMSMGLPVVTTATKGQREVLAGPLILDGAPEPKCRDMDRGPWLFDASWSRETTGFYVEIGHPGGLAEALEQVRRNSDLHRIGESGRSVASKHFGIEKFSERLVRQLVGRMPE